MAVLPPAAPGCASCAARDELLVEQGQAIEEMKADLVALAAEVRELRRRLGRNSGNSSMAPSADDLPGRAPAAPKPGRGKGGRKPGKQPGAPGSHLAWSASPDQTVPHYPAGACACGADLAVAADLGIAASHQEVEIPVVIAQVIQHDLYEVACACGRVHRAAPPPGSGMPGTVTYGLALQALCVYLLAAHAVPVHRCAELIGAITGLGPPLAQAAAAGLVRIEGGHSSNVAVVSKSGRLSVDAGLPTTTAGQLKVSPASPADLVVVFKSPTCGAGVSTPCLRERR